MAEYKLKPSWHWVSFGDVVKLNADRCANPAAAGIERYVGLEHIEPEDLRIRRWGLVEDGTTFTNRFRPGQVLFGKRRAYQRKVAVADFEGVCSSDIYVFEPKDDRLLPELLPFLCQTEAFYAHAVGTSAGSLSPRTNWTQLANYEFALPPLEEQRRIADYLSSLSQLKDSYETAHASSTQLIASLMTSLLDSPTDMTRVRSIAISELGMNNQAVLKTGPFGSKLKTDYFKSVGVPVIPIAALQEDGLNHNEFFYLDPAHVSDFAEYETVAGDIVFSRVADVGRCHLINDADTGFIISSNLIRIRIDQKLATPTYIWLLLKYSVDIRRQIAALTTQAAGRLLINTNTLERLVFMIPEQSYQSYVIARYSALRGSKDWIGTRLKSATGMLSTSRELLLTAERA